MQENCNRKWLSSKTHGVAIHPVRSLYSTQVTAERLPVRERHASSACGLRHPKAKLGVWANLLAPAVAHNGQTTHTPSSGGFSPRQGAEKLLQLGKSRTERSFAHNIGEVSQGYLWSTCRHQQRRHRAPPWPSSQNSQYITRCTTSLPQHQCHKTVMAGL